MAEKVHVRTQILDSNGNSNSIWKIINRCLPRKQDSFMASEDLTGLANELNNFFTSVGRITAQKASDLSLHHGINVNLDAPTPLHTSTDVSSELFVLNQVTENQVEKVIRRLPSNKAPGMDKISSRILKDCLPSILTTITGIVNNSFSYCVIVWVRVVLKRTVVGESPTTVLFRTTLPQTITQYELLILLGSNHLL